MTMNVKKDTNSKRILSGSRKRQRALSAKRKAKPETLSGCGLPDAARTGSCPTRWYFFDMLTDQHPSQALRLRPRPETLSVSNAVLCKITLEKCDK